uniref:Uncharacterized protein n=1 Tax=Tetranychus urticae TaxID=32264 RepID=T1KDS8_TETUR
MNRCFLRTFDDESTINRHFLKLGQLTRPFSISNRSSWCDL